MAILWQFYEVDPSREPRRLQGPFKETHRASIKDLLKELKGGSVHEESLEEPTRSPNKDRANKSKKTQELTKSLYEDPGQEFLGILNKEPQQELTESMQKDPRRTLLGDSHDLCVSALQGNSEDPLAMIHQTNTQDLCKKNVSRKSCKF